MKGLLKFFSYLYDRAIYWSGHRHAPYYLAGVSLAESSFFPIPPDVMLISMGLARPKDALRNALIATIFSVLGGMLGYLIGLYGMSMLEPYILASSYASSYHKVVHWFQTSGIWVVIIAAFTPLPYKVFTITAGAMHMAFLPFVLGSIIGRAGRFFLVCGLMYYFGKKIESKIRRYVDWIGWSMLLLVVLVFMLTKLGLITF